MVKYTAEELLHLKPEETLPVDFDAEEFRAIIENIKQIQALKEEEYAAHGFTNRRRSSHHYHTRPKVKHNKPKVTTDADGWSTLETAKGEEGEAGEESDEEDSAPFVATISTETIRVKPNNKNISSSRPADNRDIILDKQTNTFNAFAALESDEDE
ncbi:hypothetical protein TPHA_0G01390 [Tetrapisispora phaffii CBS 4417]|uniref:Cap-associated protein CAF20 n=1 Tax=Tetrapisispora phaffii (strain ATCC 24235 / CBS 4417 / NBRC 1672 / NRRL Y-8282 / UCD 70-5) TaxID=1071381 RepID=G8BVP8_TETPH|nr:hypothetical protein TPHA_0G01390 [Tetrapisispora phaffii CBS 4417]CCE63976.1 hypothetical protein TPHA_0G01390 [Tetrapisispora phaffii CBS 4417]